MIICKPVSLLTISIALLHQYIERFSANIRGIDRSSLCLVHCIMEVVVLARTALQGLDRGRRSECLCFAVQPRQLLLLLRYERRTAQRLHHILVRMYSEY